MYTHTYTYTHNTHTHFRHSGHCLQLVLLIGFPIGEVPQCYKHSNLHLGVWVAKLADQNWNGTKLPMYRVEQ